jgi:hypothetical protein
MLQLPPSGLVLNDIDLSDTRLIASPNALGASLKYRFPAAIPCLTRDNRKRGALR